MNTFGWVESGGCGSFYCLYVTCPNLVFAFTCKIEQDHLNRPTRNCAGIQTLHIGSGGCDSTLLLLLVVVPQLPSGSPEGHNHLRRLCIERSPPKRQIHKLFFLCKVNMLHCDDCSQWLQSMIPPYYQQYVATFGTPQIHEFPKINKNPVDIWRKPWNLVNLCFQTIPAVFQRSGKPFFR